MKAAASTPADPDAFVRAWVSSTSLDEVAKKTRLKRTTCTVYAARLRKLGVKLKRFRRGRIAAVVDVAALNKLINARAERKP